MNFSLNASHAEWNMLLWIFWALVAMVMITAYRAFVYETPIYISFEENVKEVCAKYATQTENKNHQKSPHI